MKRSLCMWEKVNCMLNTYIPYSADESGMIIEPCSYYSAISPSSAYNNIITSQSYYYYRLFFLLLVNVHLFIFMSVHANGKIVFNMKAFLVSFFSVLYKKNASVHLTYFLVVSNKFLWTNVRLSISS